MGIINMEVDGVQKCVFSIIERRQENKTGIKFESFGVGGDLCTF